MSSQNFKHLHITSLARSTLLPLRPQNNHVAKFLSPISRGFISRTSYDHSKNCNQNLRHFSSGNMIPKPGSVTQGGSNGSNGGSSAQPAAVLSNSTIDSLTQSNETLPTGYTNTVSDVYQPSYAAGSYTDSVKIPGITEDLTPGSDYLKNYVKIHGTMEGAATLATVHVGKPKRKYKTTWGWVEDYDPVSWAIVAALLVKCVIFFMWARQIYPLRDFFMYYDPDGWGAWYKKFSLSRTVYRSVRKVISYTKLFYTDFANLSHLIILKDKMRAEDKEDDNIDGVNNQSLRDLEELSMANQQNHDANANNHLINYNSIDSGYNDMESGGLGTQSMMPGVNKDQRGMGLAASFRPPKCGGGECGVKNNDATYDAKTNLESESIVKPSDRNYIAATTSFTPTSADWPSNSMDNSSFLPKDHHSLTAPTSSGLFAGAGGAKMTKIKAQKATYNNTTTRSDIDPTYAIPGGKQGSKRELTAEEEDAADNFNPMEVLGIRDEKSAECKVGAEEFMQKRAEERRRLREQQLGY